jgi:predicted membrane-bound spermidine synthase
VIRQLLFFVAIGAGYILIEVALIQKFVLLLGHPTHALTVVIFSMLVSSGLGSYCSRLLTAFGDRLWHCLLAIAVLVAVLAAVVPPLLAAGVTWPQPVKVAVTVLLIFPAGFLMGMPFPTGLRRLEARHQPAVRWAWSLNAAASVLGSVLAIVLAIYLGLMQTMLIGGALYAAAVLTLRPAAATA